MDPSVNDARPLRAAVLQHVACEPAAAYEPVLRKYASVDAYLLGSEPVPDLTAYDAIVVMGGPMGAYDTADHPWLADEIDALRRALDAGRAVWGVCLGAQLLAAAGGAAVYPGERPEVGVTEVRLTDAAATDPVVAGLPDPLPVLQWHGDTFDLPDGAVLLAASDAYPHQAFQLGTSYGLQFHLEAPLDLAEEWLALPAYRDSLAAVHGPSGPALLRAGLGAAQERLVSSAEQLITAWLELLAG